MRDFLAERISRPCARGRRPDVHEGRRRALRATRSSRRPRLPMTPEQIHQLGLSEVARITKEFEKVAGADRLQGHAARSSSTTCAPAPSSSPRAKEELEQGFASVKTKVEAKVPQFFSLVPKTAARDPALSAVSREVRGRRQLRAGNARRLAAGHLLLQRLRPAVAQHLGGDDPVPARGRAGPPFPDQPGAGE